MSIDKLDRFATNIGVRTAPTSGLRATGYTGGAQPSADNVNSLWGENVDKINEVVENAPSGFEEDLGPLPALQSYYPDGGDACWSSPMDDQNIISAAATKGYVGLRAYINADGERKIIALDGGATTPRQFDVYDAATMTLESNSGDLASDLPSGGTEDWRATCFCTDGTSVFACFQDVDQNPNETHRIQCWDIDGWGVNSGWAAAATGYAIGTATGTGSAVYDYGDICIANATYVAVTAPWVTITGATSDAIHLFAIAGGGETGSAAGAGSASASSPHRLTSDGTNIYFTTLLNAKIHKAAIANLQVAPADYPYNGVTNTLDIQSIGKIIVTSSTGVDTLVFGGATEEEFGTSQTGDTRICKTTGVMEFDGIDLWVRGSIDAGGTDKPAVFKVAINNVTYDATATPVAMPATESIIKEVFILDMDNFSVLNSELSPMCFDGRDIYLVGDHRASQALSGKIYRIPKAILR
jgi:hypothetical protein